MDTLAATDNDRLTAARWARLLAGDPVGDDTDDLFAPILAPPAAADGCFVLGRIAQSIDGRIATSDGTSFWISGTPDVLHTHRLRALCDAVIVGAGTVQADDPYLTTRHCEGPSPVRVIVDTDRRLGTAYRVFHDGPPTLLVCAEDARGSDTHGHAEVVRVARGPDGADPGAIVAAIAARGLRRVFVEGGGITVSRFLAHGMFDRLHVTIAPLLLGAGVPGFTLPCPGTPDRGMRLSWTVHRLGDDLLLDIPLGRAKPPAC
jgi:diaminohydroxyphosphoribosylaminopyrimidine deaminase / 5-amino-6-(5-phosphoribosylamino)uracil reductase